MTDHHFLFIDLMPNVCLPIPKTLPMKGWKRTTCSTSSRSPSWWRVSGGWGATNHGHYWLWGRRDVTRLSPFKRQEDQRWGNGGWRLPLQLSTLDMTSSSPNPNLWPKACPLGRRVCIQVFYQVVWLRGDKMTLVAFEELKWIGACHSSRICPAGPTGGSLGRRTV